MLDPRKQTAAQHGSGPVLVLCGRAAEEEDTLSSEQQQQLENVADSDSNTDPD